MDDVKELYYCHECGKDYKLYDKNHKCCGFDGYDVLGNTYEESDN